MRLASSLIVVAVGLAGCGAAPPAPASPGPAATAPSVTEAAGLAELSPALAPLSWWPGVWEADDGSSTEHWIAAAGALYGVALDPKGGFEVMIVDDGLGRGKADGILRLFAMPGGEPAVQFQVGELGERSVSFANEAHDFPKRISYRRDGEALAAEASGGGGDSGSGGDKVIPFRFRRGTAAAAPELEAADLAFAADTARRGVEGWMAAFEPQGWTLSGGKKAMGPEIRANMTPFLAQVHLAWAPVASARRGDLGFTVGKATFNDSSDGSSWKGTYVTIWHRQPDGSWKVRFDTGRTVHD